MPERMIPADKVRETRDQQPAPALPGDWRLADLPDYGRVIVTAPDPDPHGYVCFMAPADNTMGYDWHFCPADKVREARDQQPAPALPGRWRLAAHLVFGRVIVTDPDPDPHGYVYFVLPSDNTMGYDWRSFPVSKLTFLD